MSFIKVASTARARATQGRFDNPFYKSTFQNPICKTTFHKGLSQNSFMKVLFTFSFIKHFYKTAFFTLGVDKLSRLCYNGLERGGMSPAREQ
jgi:hypothetical protein